MFEYVWNENKMGRLGRPNSSIDSYFVNSEAKINAWRAEQLRTNSAVVRAKLKNKISALRSRMKQKITKDEEKNIRLASHQSNLRMFIKSLLELDGLPVTTFYVEILERMGLSYEQFFGPTQPSRNIAALKHILINEMEKMVWIDDRR